MHFVKLNQTELKAAKERPEACTRVRAMVLASSILTHSQAPRSVGEPRGGGQGDVLECWVPAQSPCFLF